MHAAGANTGFREDAAIPGGGYAREKFLKRGDQEVQEDGRGCSESSGRRTGAETGADGLHAGRPSAMPKTTAYRT